MYNIKVDLKRSLFNEKDDKNKEKEYSISVYTTEEIVNNHGEAKLDEHVKQTFLSFNSEAINDLIPNIEKHMHKSMDDTGCLITKEISRALANDERYKARDISSVSMVESFCGKTLSDESLVRAKTFIMKNRQYINQYFPLCKLEMYKHKETSVATRLLCTSLNISFITDEEKFDLIFDETLKELAYYLNKEVYVFVNVLKRHFLRLSDYKGLELANELEKSLSRFS